MISLASALVGVDLGCPLLPATMTDDIVVCLSFEGKYNVYFICKGHIINKLGINQ